jgi:ABC-type multidrug transport system ATPase subunit
VVDALVGDAVAAGATVVVSSHELERVAGLGPRVVTISGGVVVDDTGPADEGGSRV